MQASPWRPTTNAAVNIAILVLVLAILAAIFAQIKTCANHARLIGTARAGPSTASAITELLETAQAQQAQQLRP